MIMTMKQSKNQTEWSEEAPDDHETLLNTSHPCEFLPEAEINPSTWKTRWGDFFLYISIFLAIIINR